MLLIVSCECTICSSCCACTKKWISALTSFDLLSPVIHVDWLRRAEYNSLRVKVSVCRALEKNPNHYLKVTVSVILPAPSPSATLNHTQWTRLYAVLHCSSGPVSIFSKNEIFHTCLTCSATLHLIMGFVIHPVGHRGFIFKVQLCAKITISPCVAVVLISWPIACQRSFLLL